MKKGKVYITIIGILLLILAIVIVIPKKNYREIEIEDSDNEMSIMDHEEYENINPNNIEKIEIRKYTEGGLDTDTITEKEEITRTYNFLKNKKMSKETDMSCEDNTTIYVFSLTDNTKKSIEIECDWIVIKDKRYIIK